MKRKHYDTILEKTFLLLLEAEKNDSTPIMIAVDVIIDETYMELREERVERNYSNIRKWFEAMTLDACGHYNRYNIWECQDGWSEYVDDEFKEEFGIDLEAWPVYTLVKLQIVVDKIFGLKR